MQCVYVSRKHFQGTYKLNEFLWVQIVPSYVCTLKNFIYKVSPLTIILHFSIQLVSSVFLFLQFHYCDSMLSNFSKLTHIYLRTLCYHGGVCFMLCPQIGTCTASQVGHIKGDIIAGNDVYESKIAFNFSRPFSETTKTHFRGRMQFCSQQRQSISVQLFYQICMYIMVGLRFTAYRQEREY